MQPYVQVAVLQFFPVHVRDERLLQLYAKALCMLYKRYDEETREKYRQFIGKSRVPSRQWKLPYKPHFDRFLEFASKNKDRAKKFASCNVKGIDVMVTAVVTFSKLYLEEHRYDDAICVLKFVDAMYTGSERRYELKRLLIRAYLEKPLRDEYNDNWTKIENLSLELMDDAERLNNIERKWAVVLDLARFYSESHKPGKASCELKRVWEFEMRMENCEPKLYICLDVTLDKFKKRKLAVERKIEEGRIHFVNAKLRSHQGLEDAAAKEMAKATSCWEDAMQAISSWQLDHDSDWTMETEQMLAEAHIETGNLDHADKILARLLQQLKHAPDHAYAAKRTWDIECKQAHAALQRDDKPRREKAIELLGDRLQQYENDYGDQHACTHNCAYLLRSALRKEKRDEQAGKLEQKYQLREMSAGQVVTVSRVARYTWLSWRDWFLVVLLLYLLANRL